MDELTLPSHGLKGSYSLELVPDAAAPSLTRLRIKHAARPGGDLLTLAEIPLTTFDLEELARLCVRHAERAQPHAAAAITAVFAQPAGHARDWL